MFPRYSPSRALLFLFASVLCIWLYKRPFPSSPTSTAIESAGALYRHGGKNTNSDGTEIKSLFLTDEQCVEAFPGLTREIENAIAKGPFGLKRVRDDLPGLVQGRIKDGKLYIISAPADNSLHRVPAILHALHRAILTSPSPLPDTIFALNINDIPRTNTWSFARSDDDLSPTTPWLMPHYHSWSWPMSALGTLDEVLHRIEDVEKAVPWEKKIDKAVWRGSQLLNPDWSEGMLRRGLLKLAEGREWADVKVTGDDGTENMLKGEDFCRYKYIIYAEGKSYSGRLPFHQACTSIILTPPPTFRLHTTHLLRPVFSSLFLSPAGHPASPSPPALSAYPYPNTTITWPLSHPLSVANAIFVAPDWSDLEATILYLRNHAVEAKGVAERSREGVVRGGFLSEAAEVCYWRALIRAWERMVRVDDITEWGEGMRWETFVLMGRTTF